MIEIPVKRGLELTLPINILFVVIMIFSEEAGWMPIVIMVLTFLLVNYMLFSIRYQMDEENLYIKNGIFGTQTIKVSNIFKIEKTNNPIASPAPSIFGRVEIYYPNESVVISPKDFDDFVTKITKINPEITIKK